MTATGHAVIGTLIAAKIGNPAFAIPLAFVSHMAADAFPHWDSGTNERTKGRKRVQIEAYFDVIFGFILSYGIIHFFFPQTNLLYAFIVILFSQGLDWLTAPYYFFKIKRAPFTWAYQLQKVFDNKLDKPWGIINQVAVLMLGLFIAKIF